jgi:hypothetical protein
MEDWLKLRGILIAYTECIVDVDVLSSILYLFKEGLADGTGDLLLSAVVLDETLVGRGCKDAVPVSHLNVHVRVVVAIVGHTVANDPTLKVGGVGARAWGFGAVANVPVKLLYKSWYIDPSI